MEPIMLLNERKSSNPCCLDLSRILLFIKRYHIVYTLGKRIPWLPVEQIFCPGIVKKKIFGKIGDIADWIED